jgi:hypothetical protein
VRLNRSRQRYETDKKLQAQLQAFLKAEGDPDPEKPMRVPIYVTSDNPQEVLFRRMAMYRGGGQPVCTCERFVNKPEVMLMQQGIPLPKRSDNNLGREYFAGEYRRRIYDPSTHKRIGITTGVCDPANCPFATGIDRTSYHTVYGTWPKSDQLGTIMCRPHVVFTAVIADISQGRNPVAVLRSKSWNTGSQLSFWLNGIAEATGGYLRGLPMWLTLEFQEATDGDGKSHTIPVWTLEARRFDWAELPQAGAHIQIEQLEAARRHNETARLMEADVKGLPAGRDFAEEFWPETQGGDEPADPRESVEWIARTVLGWSDTEVADVLARCDATGDYQQEYQRLAQLAHTQAEGKARRLEIEPEQVPEDVPAAPPQIPCPDDLSQFPTSAREWAEALRACGWDENALRAVLDHTEVSTLKQLFGEDADPSRLWLVMVAINWYAAGHDLTDPLQPLFDELAISHGDGADTADDTDEADDDGASADDGADEFIDGEIIEDDPDDEPDGAEAAGDDELNADADDRDRLDQFRPDEGIPSMISIEDAVEEWPMADRVAAVAAVFPNGAFDQDDPDARWEVMKALQRYARASELAEPFSDVFSRELTQTLPFDDDELGDSGDGGGDE